MSKAEKKERKSYRVLFDETMKAIKRGEKFEATLETILAKKGSHEPTVSLLDGTKRGLEVLRRDADKLEKLGWPDDDKDKD